MLAPVDAGNPIGGHRLDLLKAGLLPPGRARKAWERWREATGGLADAADRKLLPLAEWNLTAGEGRAAAPLVGPGFVELGWLRSERLVAEAGVVLEALGRGGVKTVVLKGLALAHLYYPHRSLRPMEDIDLLVGPEAWDAARAVVEELGWKRLAPEPASRRAHLHAESFTLTGAIELDLHAHALLESCAPRADDGFLDRAVPFAVEAAGAFTLSPADHLLSVCVHGLRFSPVPAVQWAADAALVVRGAGKALRWETLVAEARTRDLALPVSSALRFLARSLEVDVPADVLAELERSGRGLVRRLELAARAGPPHLLSGLFLHWRTFSRERPELSPPGRAVRFPAYLRELWAVDRPAALPAVALRKAAARLRRRPSAGGDRARA